MFLIGSLAFLSLGCKPSHRELIDRADEYVLDQRAQIAKYLYMQVLKEHARRDEVRYRALKGLAEVSLTQLFDYPVVVMSIEKIIEEFDREPVFFREIPFWRKKLSEVYRIHLGKPLKAKEIMEPLANRGDLSAEFYQEMGKNLMALGEFDAAEARFSQAWVLAQGLQDCPLLRSLQMDMIQNYSLGKNCERAAEWTQKTLPGSCRADTFALSVERAHCLEIMGDPMAAIKVYEDVLKENPQNVRAHFLLENVKRREKEKKLK